MNKVTKKELRKTALKLLPAIYDSAMRTGAEDGLFQHEGWRTGLCLDAFLLAEAFEDTASFRDAELEPKLKQLDQSVFDGLDTKWRFAAVDADGVASYYNGMPDLRDDEFVYWDVKNGATQSQRLSGKFDTTNWQNSLIERDKVELTGSDLCRAMLERGDKAVLCLVIDNKENGVKQYDAITKTSGRSAFISHYHYWHKVTPVNNQGEPLTASEAGL